MALATRFGSGTRTMTLDTPLTDDQLFRVAPSIFAEDKHGSRSDRYTYIPTIEVLNGLRNEGFQPFMAAQSRSRIEGKSEFTKHMVRLRQAGQITGPEAFEIILINSHDGTSSYQMLAGIFRFVCHNGMVTGDTIQDMRIPHRGNITDNVIDAAYTILEDYDTAAEEIEKMKSLQLTEGEQAAYAQAALALKYEDYAPVEPDQLLQARRYEDRKDSIWSTFNRVQENMIKGGLHGRTTNGKKTSTRKVQSIDTDVKLNKALWILANKMAEYKA
ncbi:DUF932 domain-containing protein (plasmid) [Oscillospiraceae bacterium MB08-C2-2]|nr:DUF932 domain-containing protein [Oscillospiraceae bacterium MB08-C2-2]